VEDRPVPLERDFNVTFRYPVHFTEGVLDRSNTCLRDVVAGRADYLPAKVAFVVDHGLVGPEGGHPDLRDQIEQYCRGHEDVLRLMAPVLELPGGERVKNEWRYVLDVLRLVQDARLCRHSYVVAIGGGAVLDVVGFASAMAHRGVRLVRVPTTVLAQDDSAIGVKNGINAFDKKNYLGAFAPPFAVINDARFLATLSDRDWRSGIAEAVKVALIRDAAFFEFIEAHAAPLRQRDAGAMQRLVRRSAELHYAHITTSGDPFELGSSRPLDYGHWAAHKLEQVSDYQLRHGEAVAIGIALDATYAWLSGFLPEADWRRVIGVLQAVGLPVYTPELSQHLDKDADSRNVLRGLVEFQEHLGGRLTIMLLGGIGRAFDVHEIRRETMIEAIETLRRITIHRAATEEHEGFAKGSPS
jgi:3-dehydroquinate synthase